MQVHYTVDCEIKYEPGRGYFVRKGTAPEQEISKEEIVNLHTDHALMMLKCFPSAWCAIPKPGSLQKAA